MEGAAMSMEGDGSLKASRYAAIVTNYKRPNNIARIVKCCLLSNRCPDVYVIDNSERNTAAHISTSFPGINYISNGKNMGAGFRFTFSHSLDKDYFICIDDDIFLEPSQIDQVFSAIEAFPNRLHGLEGQVGFWMDGKIILSWTRRSRKNIMVINRLYGYTKTYVTKVISVARSHGYSNWSRIGPFDDILMSVCGGTRPMCHDFGSYESCPTAVDRDIAACMAIGFSDIRSAIITELSEFLTPRSEGTAEH